MSAVGYVVVEEGPGDPPLVLFDRRGSFFRPMSLESATELAAEMTGNKSRQGHNLVGSFDPTHIANRGGSPGRGTDRRDQNIAETQARGLDESAKEVYQGHAWAFRRALSIIRAELLP